MLTLSTDGSNVIKWSVNAAFKVHKDFKGHTDAAMTVGKGAAMSISCKQKVNSGSSTKAELIRSDDIIGQVMWTKCFPQAQGCQVKDNIMFQDNKSTMLLKKNGQESAGKCSRHISAQCFFIANLTDHSEVQILHCPMDVMAGDHMSKPLVGALFTKFCKEIMNLP